MSILRWLGGTSEGLASANARAMVAGAQVTGFDVATTYTLTATDENGKTFTVSSIGVTDAAGTATALAAAWNASIDYPMRRVTASTSTDTVILTADNAGQPFSVAASAASGTGTIGAMTTTTTNRGVADYATPQNWEGGAIPTASDSVIVPASSGAISYSLDQSSVSINAFTVEEGHTTQIGGTDNGYLKITTDNAAPVLLSGTGSTRIDFGASATAVTVRNSATGTLAAPGLRLKGTALTDLYVFKGSVGFGIEADDTTSECDEFYVSYITNASSDAKLTIGEGVSAVDNSAIDLIEKSGGDVLVQAAVDTLTQTGSGTAESRGTGAIATWNAHGGTSYPNSTGTITTLNGKNGATIDFTQNMAARTVTTTNNDACTIKSHDNVTFTNKPLPTTTRYTISTLAA